jgi:Vesicle transport v-SNARE protein N-terminus
MDHGEDSFEAYAKDFVALLRESSSAEAAASNGEREDCLQQAHDLLQQMTVEARATACCDVDERRANLDRLQVYKSQWKAAKLSLNQDALFRPHNDNASTVRKSDLDQVDDGMDDTTTTNQRLAYAVQSLHDTEHVASGIASNLALQREQLQQSSQTTRSLREMTASAHATANHLLAAPWWRKKW